VEKRQKIKKTQKIKQNEKNKRVIHMNPDVIAGIALGTVVVGSLVTVTLIGLKHNNDNNHYILNLVH
jgi:orotate phosphoribosyltransferase